MKQMNIKDVLVAVDLDGTLLRDDKTVDPITVEAIHQYQKKGLRFTFATSRPLEVVKKYIDLLQINLPVVVSSGTMITTLKEVIYIDELDSNLKNEILSFVKLDDVFFHCREGLVIGKRNKRNVRFEKECKGYYNPIDIYQKDLVNMKPCQTTIMQDEEGKYLEKVKELNQRYKFKYVATKDGVIVIVNEGMNKGQGVKNLAKLLSVDEDNVIVFGDDMNDVEMFECFSNSVVMGNSTEEVRKYAKYLTKTNEENGIIYALKEIFNL